MSKMLVKALQSNNLTHKAFWVLVVAVIFFVFLYIYFVQNTIWQAVNMQRGFEQTKVLASQVSDLETQYLQLSRQVNLNMANEAGLQDVSVTYLTARRAVVYNPANEI